MASRDSRFESHYVPEGRYPQPGQSIGAPRLTFSVALGLFLVHAGYSWLAAELWLAGSSGTVLFAVVISVLIVAVTVSLSWGHPLRLARGIVVGVSSTTIAGLFISVGLTASAGIPVGDYLSRLPGDLLLLGYLTGYFPITFLLTWAGSALIMKVGRPSSRKL